MIMVGVVLESEFAEGLLNIVTGGVPGQHPGPHSNRVFFCHMVLNTLPC